MLSTSACEILVETDILARPLVIGPLFALGVVVLNLVEFLGPDGL
jgi:hypothetical protein